MGIVNRYVWICFMMLTAVFSFSMAKNSDLDDLKYPVRLIGETFSKGRLEIYYNDEWGTVCDDDFTPFGCELVCKQIGYWNGTCVSIQTDGCLLKKKDDFEIGTGRIWLSDVHCTGYELQISECQHPPWGQVNCFHSEDVGCVCYPSQGQCKPSRHRIVPLDEKIPSVGIVEVRGEDGVWGAVCDDHWDNYDATVFCRCLGYYDYKSFRAMTAGRPTEVIKNYRGSFLYDEVHCSKKDSYEVKNLWDCQIKINWPSRCDIRKELALVICSNYSLNVNNKFEDVERINTSVECRGSHITLCISPIIEFDIKSSSVGLYPRCSTAVLRDYDAQVGFCYEMDLLQCQPLADSEETKVKKNYCYDISFQAKDNLFFLGEVMRRGCCALEKSTRVETSFPSLNVGDAAGITRYVAVDTVRPRLSIPCFWNNSLHSLTRGDVVDRGSTIHCNVVADVWDEDLQLVVRDCKLFTLAEGDENARVSSYSFFRDRCVVTDLLNVQIFNNNRQSWGFSFYLPKFEFSDRVFLTCDVYLCDVQRDGKEFCDRSCGIESLYGDTMTPAHNGSVEKVEGRNDTKEVGHMNGNVSESDFVTDKLIRIKRNGNEATTMVSMVSITSELFVVRDVGTGPIIRSHGNLTIEKTGPPSIDAMVRPLRPLLKIIVLLFMLMFVTIFVIFLVFLEVYNSRLQH